VLEYERPQIGGDGVNNFDPAIKKDGMLLTEGTISIQGESHPTEIPQDRVDGFVAEII